MQMHLSLMVGGKHAVRAERDKDALQARGEQRIRCAIQARLVRDRHAGEQLGLHAVWLERVEPPEDRLELSGLRRRNGIGKERRGAVLTEIADALRAEVRIEHDERGGVERS